MSPTTSDLDVALAAARAGAAVLDGMFGADLAREHKTSTPDRVWVAARDAESHATLLELVARHR